MSVKLSKIPIKSLPYEMRLRNYEREKSEIVAQNMGVSPEKMEKMLKDLADKWRV